LGSLREEDTLVIFPIHEQALQALQDCDWDGFVARYLEPNHCIIEAYYRNFVVFGPWSWDECVERYRRRWFAEAGHRKQVLERLREFDFRRHVDNCVKQIQHGLPGALDVDVVILLGLGVSNAFQLLVDGKPVVCLAVEAWGGTFYNVDMPFDDVLIWLSHEMGHALRYRKPVHPLAAWFHQNGFQLDEATRHFPLYEFLVDEGLAVTASRLVAPDRPLHRILGFTPDQLNWCVEHDAELISHLNEVWCDPPRPEGYWRYFGGDAGGLPVRTGYYVGYRMVERFVERTVGISVSDLFEIPAEAFVKTQ
jgi:uncharacterized protein YjaZ